MSLFSVMNVANKALFASQIGMHVAGQNIANVDVPGYSRKRVDLAAGYHRDGRFGQIGFGVEVLGIARIRNEYIDAQIRRQSHELGKNAAISQALESAENILIEPGDTGILEYLNKFFDSWEFLADNPSDRSARTAVRDSGSMLVDVFHNVSSELEKLKIAKNDEIVSLVGRVNDIAAELFNLNGEISIATLGGNGAYSAADSKDRRDFLMRELSEIVDFDYYFDQSGQLTLSVCGNILVSPVSINKLEIFDDTRVDEDHSYGYHRYGVRMEKGKNQIFPQSGELKGLMIARDELIPKYEAKLNELAEGFVKKINDIHTSGYNLYENSGLTFFDPTCLTAKTIKLSSSIVNDVSNIAAAKGGSFTQAAKNTITFTAAGDGIQLFKDPPFNTERATNISRGKDDVTIKTTGGVILTEGEDYRVDYLTGTIELLSTGSAYIGLGLEVSFAYNTSGFPGPGNNENAIAMGAVRGELTMGASASFRGNTATFGQFYGSIVSELGLDRSGALADIRTREFLIEQYDTHQDSIAGVSIDEEMASLIMYNYTYQAAARIFTTAQAMLDTLMNI